MSEEVYTVEQFAERLKLHPKTVLRFIKDGRLRAVKVGKSWRILRTEMEAAMTGFSLEDYRGAIGAYQSALEKRTARSAPRVTSIVDLEGVAPDLAERMARTLPAARTSQTAHADAMNIEVIYDPPRRHLKVLIVGSPGDTAAMLKMVEALSEFLTMAPIWKTTAAGEAVRARYAQFLSHWPQPCAQRRVATSQGETFVMESGTDGAPAVVFLHGSASNSVVWLRDAAALGDRFKVYAVDMIGEPGLSAESRPALASGAYAQWLDEVLTGLGVERAALVGISLGGWLALDYATHHPDKVSAMVLLCPGGVGKHRNVLLWAAPLLALGPWGRARFMKIVGAPEPSGVATPAMQAFAAFNAQIHKDFIVRRETLPRFSDAVLQRLKMPVMAILGGRDAFIDSPGTRVRLAANLPQADIRWLPQASHFLMGHTDEIDAFLAKELAP